MMRAMSIRILTSRQVKGGKWADAHPNKADDLWVMAEVRGNRRRKHVGPPTPENRREAERKRAAWAALLDGVEISDMPTFREAGPTCAAALLATPGPRLAVATNRSPSFKSDSGVAHSIRSRRRI